MRSRCTTIVHYVMSSQQAYLAAAGCGSSAPHAECHGSTQEHTYTGGQWRRSMHCVESNQLQGTDPGGPSRICGDRRRRQNVREAGLVLPTSVCGGALISSCLAKLPLQVLAQGWWPRAYSCRARGESRQPENLYPGPGYVLNILSRCLFSRYAGCGIQWIHRWCQWRHI